MNTVLDAPINAAMGARSRAQQEPSYAAQDEEDAEDVIWTAPLVELLASSGSLLSSISMIPSLYRIDVQLIHRRPTWWCPGLSMLSSSF
jgi:hypothetical protein